MHHISVAILVALLAGYGSAATDPPPKSPPIRGEGCILPGAETRCLTLKDVRTGALYELLVKGIPPPIGTGIEFTGVPHHGVTTCMQGTAVDVITWVHKDLKCTQGTAPKPKH